jgi:hypothetical protein
MARLRPTDSNGTGHSRGHYSSTESYWPSYTNPGASSNNSGRHTDSRTLHIVQASIRNLRAHLHRVQHCTATRQGPSLPMRSLQETMNHRSTCAQPILLPGLNTETMTLVASATLPQGRLDRANETLSMLGDHRMTFSQVRHMYIIS